MNQPSRKKLIASWTLEILFLILQILTLPFFIPIPKHTKGKRGTLVITTDLLTSPLLYLLLRHFFIKNHYNVYFYYCFNPFISLYQHSQKLSNFLLKIPEENITIIGHGVGGLLPLSISDEARKKIQKLINLNTPFFGTQIFSYLDFIAAFKDILPRSEYLRLYRMNALLYEEFYPFVAWQDEWIVPATLSRFGQGRDILLDIPGRLNLILHRENLQTLIQFYNQISSMEIPSLPEPAQKKSKKSKKNIKTAKKNSR